jgi:23S rRNA pseudouridine1911/1915/1917 synthase
LDPLPLITVDGPLIAASKPAGIATQTIPGLPSLEAAVKQFLRVEGDKTGNVYLGVPHRLDRPVSGVVIFAKNSKAAARLAEQFRDRTVRKTYWALVVGVPEAAGSMRDTLRKIPDQPQAELLPEGSPDGKVAELTYRLLSTFSAPEFSASPISLVEVDLLTGRMHQIRIQFASRGWPVVGDTLYGGPALPEGRVPPPPNLDYGLLSETLDPERARPIALHARRLALKHPIRYDDLVLTAPLPEWWPIDEQQVGC